jgi:zinc transport system substrate-binding protein
MRIRALHALALAGSALSLALPAGAPAAGPLTVAVSIAPQAWFVERIGGADVETLVLVGAGQSPATFDPAPRLMVRLAGADAYLTIGVPMENSLLSHLQRTLPRLRIFDLREGIDLVPLGESASALDVDPSEAASSRDAEARAEDGHGEDHGHGHEHGELDPHVWLSPALARTLARNVCAALCELRPAGAEGFRRRLAELDAELVALDQELTTRLAPLRGREMLVYHPAFGYFAAAYGLRQMAVEQGGLAPSARHLARILEFARARDLGTIFVQPQFSESSARALAREAGLAIAVLDPLARDYPGNLRAIAATVREALLGQSAAPEGEGR